MSSNLCIKPTIGQQQIQYGKLLLDNIEDKTRSTEGSSKLCENCRLIKQQMQSEIFLLKDKSHQSFMQVIQVQQLHEQELQLLRTEHQQELTTMKQQIIRLNSQLSQLQQQLSAMEKNSKHHVVELCNDDSRSFFIQNIDMIKCQEEGKEEISKLDQSEMWQFHQIVDSEKQDNLGINVIKQLQQQQQQYDPSPAKHQPKHSQPQTTAILQQKLSLLNIRLIQLQSQLQSLTQTNQQLKKQCSRLQLSQKSIKNNYQSLYKQSKFMADHIRTLANDKFKLQKRVKQLQRELKGSNAKQYRKSLNFDDKPPTVTFSTPSIINNNNSNNSQQLLLFASLGYDRHYVMTTSRENSIDNEKKEDQNEYQQQKPLSTMTIPKTVSIDNFEQLNNNNKDTQLLGASLTQSQLLQVNKDVVQCRKTVPSYKKVNHITPTPSPTSFKKPYPPSNEVKKKQSLQLPKWSHQHNQQQQQYQKQDIVQKSDFMDEIKMQLQRKVLLKKTPIVDHLETHRPSSLFIGSRDRRSTTKR